MKKFKEFKEELSAGATTVGTGLIAGTGGKAGEPGVDLSKRRKSPIMGYTKRKLPKI